MSYCVRGSSVNWSSYRLYANSREFAFDIFLINQYPEIIDAWYEYVWVDDMQEVELMIEFESEDHANWWLLKQ